MSFVRRDSLSRFLAICCVVVATSKASAAPPSSSPTRQVGPWLLIDTPNFTICSTRGHDPVELGNRCEALRKELFEKLAGRIPEAAWSPRCYVVCHPTEASYARDVGSLASPSRGSSDVIVDQGRIVSRRIDLRGDRPNPLREALPHEMSHVVIADFFTSRHCPLWADEGLAVLSDIAAKRSGFRQDLTEAFDRDETFAIAELLRLDRYPASQRCAVFYGQSVSLVEFLMRRKSPEEFFSFVRKATEIGYDAALEQAYGIADVGELERLWKASVRSR